MAYTGRFDLDQHFTLLRSLEFDGFDLKRSAGFMCDSSLNLHFFTIFPGNAAGESRRSFAILGKTPATEIAISQAPKAPRALAVLLVQQDHPVANRPAPVSVEHVERYRF